jgi:hypothetical protein
MDVLDPLILDFLEWVALAPKPYAEVMDAWRTSCPRLTVWEDAIDRGLVERATGENQRPFITLTPGGRQLLKRSGRLRQSGPHDGLNFAAAG